MRRQMTERETIWKDEAPPSTAMRNKKNIKRKKKLNTPKPSVFALFSEARRGLSVISPPLSATGLSSFIFCPPQSKMLPSLQMSCNPLPTQLLDMALRLAAWLGAATQRYSVWSWNTPLAGVEQRAQLKLRSLSSPSSEERETEQERRRERDVEVGPSVGLWIRDMLQ